MRSLEFAPVKWDIIKSESRPLTASQNVEVTLNYKIEKPIRALALEIITSVDKGFADSDRCAATLNYKPKLDQKFLLDAAVYTDISNYLNKRNVFLNTITALTLEEFYLINAGLENDAKILTPADADLELKVNLKTYVALDATNTAGTSTINLYAMFDDEARLIEADRKKSVRFVFYPLNASPAGQSSTTILPKFDGILTRLFIYTCEAAVPSNAALDYLKIRHGATDVIVE